MKKWKMMVSAHTKKSTEPKIKTNMKLIKTEQIREDRAMEGKTNTTQREIDMK